MRRNLVLIVTASVLTACSFEQRTDREEPTSQSPRKEIIQPEGVARLPVFSSAVRSGDFIFLSGALGALPNVTPPQLIEGGIEPETRQTFANIITILDAAGATLEDAARRLTGGGVDHARDGGVVGPGPGLAR